MCAIHPADLEIAKREVFSSGGKPKVKFTAAL
jgi:hypothetical protein